MSIRVRRGLVSVGTCSARTGYSLDVFGEVVVLSGLFRRCRLSVGTCSERSVYCQYLFNEYG